MAIADIDLRKAINAISDVVQNRPRPIRSMDQIYMKSGDMVVQSEIVARWADGKRLCFIGDGDAISVCVAYLQTCKLLNYGPSKIVVYDFDERIVNAVARFADHQRIENLSSVLYNCADPFPDEGKYDFYYTNPPWGASNGGESVCVFAQRGMEAVGYKGGGMVVIADDNGLAWPKVVLANIQNFSRNHHFYVSQMMAKMHKYHLDEDLYSCNLMFQALPGAQPPGKSEAIVPERLVNFYGRESDMNVRYIREKKRVDYGKAHDDEYQFEYREG